MYIEQDFVGPATLDLQAQRRMQNRIIKYWPRTTADGVEIFGIMYLYIKGLGVQQSDSHKKIYNLLGVKIKDLEENSWKGIENYYMYFKVTQGFEEDLGVADLERYVAENMPFTTKLTQESEVEDRSDWVSTDLTYEPLKVDQESNVLSNTEIVNLIKNNPGLATYNAVDSNVLTMVALLDKNEVVFERRLTVQKTQLTTVGNLFQTNKTNKTKVLKEANLKFQFRRKLVDDPILDSYLGSVASYVNGLPKWVRTSLDIQAKRLYRTIVPFTDDDIILSRVGLGGGWGTTSTIGNSLVGYKIAGVSAMPSKTFNKEILAQIDTGYTEEEVDSWKKVVTIVVAIIVIVVAVILAVPSGGASLSSIGAAATFLTIATLAMQGLAIVLAKRDPAWGKYIGKAAVTLGVITTVLGIIVIVGTLVQAAAREASKEAAKEALKEAGEKATEKAVEKAAAQIVAEKGAVEVLKELSLEELGNVAWEMMKNSFNTTTEMTLTKVLGWATKGFQAYAKYVNPPDEGVDELKEKVEEQQEVLEDLTGPNLKDKIDYTFSSPYYNIYDFNEFMQGMPHTMTQGKIDNCFNKYYDPNSGGKEYRGYLG